MGSILQTQPYALNGREGQCLRLLGAQVYTLATTEQTGGAFNLLEAHCPPGFATPVHIHYASNVAVFVLEGALTVYWGDERQPAGAGAIVYQPRGTPHGFRVEGDRPARILYLAVPGGFDRFILEIGTPTKAPDPSPDAAGRLKDAVAVAARYKIEVLGPLPGESDDDIPY